MSRRLGLRPQGPLAQQGPRDQNMITSIDHTSEPLKLPPQITSTLRPNASLQPEVQYDNEWEMPWDFCSPHLSQISWGAPIENLTLRPYQALKPETVPKELLLSTSEISSQHGDIDTSQVPLQPTAIQTVSRHSNRPCSSKIHTVGEEYEVDDVYTEPECSSHAELRPSSYDSSLSQSSISLLPGQSLLKESSPPHNPSGESFLFDIEINGEPKISWEMYYDFQVTKNEAYWQLQPIYLPIEKRPSRIISEKITIDGTKLHPCHYLRCKARPFTRHYDLERHFQIHQSSQNQLYCDYKKCSHPGSFRIDHGREHYREYHMEDLVKRGSRKTKKTVQSKTVEEFLSTRVHNLDLTFWRCTKCLSRVEVVRYRYTCPSCNLDCDPERVECRKRAIAARQRVRPKGQRPTPDALQNQ